MMTRNFMIPSMAAAGVVVTVVLILSDSKSGKTSPQNSMMGPELPLACVGIIESSTQNIAIGTHVPGIVMSVVVKAGDEVQAGESLLSIDDRVVRAELDVRKAALRVAEQQLVRLEHLPRLE